MIIGISGKAGSGKDTVADLLVKEFSFVRVSLADPLKRICRDVFDFSEDQLWGPSEKRNEPDKRYVRWIAHVPHMLTDEGVKEFPNGSIPQYLTPRHALQQLGTEWGRNCYDNVWVNYCLRVAKKLLERPNGEVLYTPQKGLVEPGVTVRRHCAGVVIPDVRFKNEVDGLKRGGAVLLRVKRPGAGLEGAAAAHASEAEQDEIPDSAFDTVLDNTGTIEDLHWKVKQLFNSWGK